LNTRCRGAVDSAPCGLPGPIQAGAMVPAWESGGDARRTGRGPKHRKNTLPPVWEFHDTGCLRAFQKQWANSQDFLSFALPSGFFSGLARDPNIGPGHFQAAWPPA